MDRSPDGGKVPAFCGKTIARCPPNGIRRIVEAGARLTPSRDSSASSSAIRRPAAGSRKLSVPTATPRAAAQEIGRVTPAGDPAHPDHRDLDAPAHRRDLRERNRPDRRARTRRRCPPPSHGPPRCGSRAMPVSVLIRETASAPASSAAAATARGVGGVRRELHDQRLAGLAGAAARPRRGLAGVRAHDSPVSTFGQESSARASPPRRAPPRGRRARELVAAEAHHRDDQRHGQLREHRQVGLEEARRGPCSGARSS